MWSRSLGGLKELVEQLVQEVHPGRGLFGFLSGHGGFVVLDRCLLLYDRSRQFGDTGFLSQGRGEECREGSSESNEGLHFQALRIGIPDFTCLVRRRWNGREEIILLNSLSSIRTVCVDGRSCCPEGVGGGGTRRRLACSAALRCEDRSKRHTPHSHTPLCFVYAAQCRTSTDGAITIHKNVRHLSIGPMRLLHYGTCSCTMCARWTLYMCVWTVRYCTS